jgi:hypothetical protein
MSKDSVHKLGIANWANNDRSFSLIPFSLHPKGPYQVLLKDSSIAIQKYKIQDSTKVYE